jgi:SAM-dependent methyltransferase
MNKAAGLYRLLGEDVRLRMLRVLGSERLNVTELTAVLGLAQSGVSRHLGLLKDAGLVVEEPAGGFTYYRVSPGLESGALAPLWAVLQAQFTALAPATGVRADDARLDEVRRLRKENFDTHGTETGQLVPGRSWAAWARALGHLLPPLDVADLGCGEGYLTIEAAAWARRVVAIDRSAAVLRKARELSRKRRVSNVVWKRGDIEKAPLPDASVDVALLSQALHHASSPARAVGEAARVVRPGGRVIVLDLRPHAQAWVKDRLGDQWLGFTDDQLVGMLKAAGLVDIRVQVGARRAGGPFTVVIVSGRKATSVRRRSGHTQEDS